MREFLFLICVEKAISMKILVLPVIISSRHRNCLIRGYLYSFFVSKALTRSYHARSGFHTNNSWIQPRTPHFLWRKRNYIYSPKLVVWPTHTSLAYICFSFPGKEIAPWITFMRKDLEKLPTGRFVALCTTCSTKIRVLGRSDNFRNLWARVFFLYNPQQFEARRFDKNLLEIECWK